MFCPNPVTTEEIKIYSSTIRSLKNIQNEKNLLNPADKNYKDDCCPDHFKEGIII